MKKLDLEHKEKMGQQGIDLAQINKGYFEAEVDDRKSAREMYVSTRDKTTPVLAWIVIISSMLVAAAVLTGHVDVAAEYKELAGVVIGYVFSEAKAVLQFYFGSSSDSQRKTDTLSDIARMP